MPDSGFDAPTHYGPFHTIDTDEAMHILANLKGVHAAEMPVPMAIVLMLADGHSLRIGITMNNRFTFAHTGPRK